MGAYPQAQIHKEIAIYQQRINHHARTAIVIAIDGSVSMQNWTMLHHTRMRKSEAAALIANFIIDELIVRACRGSEIRNYYDVAVIGYSGNGVESLLPSDENNFSAIDHLYEHLPQPKCYHINQEVDDGTLISMPITLHQWIKPSTCGTTPMYEALAHIKWMLSNWCMHRDNRDSFPPLLINITDGGFNDANEHEVIDIAKEIQQISTRDGNVLVFNIHLATEGEGDSVCEQFPTEQCFNTSDPECLALFNMSSTLPDVMEDIVAQMYSLTEAGRYRCFARNSTICEVINLIDLGTEGPHSLRNQ